MTEADRGRRFDGRFWIEQAFELSSAATAIVSGPNHIVVVANPACREIVGVDDFIGTPARSALPHLAEHGLFEIFDKVFRTGQEIFRRSMPIPSPPGAKLTAMRYLDLTCRPVLGDGGKIDGVFVQGHDVTERVAAEVKLRESEEHYRYRVELDQRSPWTADERGRIIEMASRWPADTGLPLEASFGRGWLTVVHPDDVEHVKATFAGAAHQPIEVRFRSRTASGEYRWIASRAYPRTDEQGRVVRWYGTNEDITDQVLADKRLRDSEEHYRCRIEFDPRSNWTADKDGRLIEHSNHWSEQTGKPQEASLGRGWLGAVHADDAPNVKAAYAQAGRTGTSISVRFRVQVRTGEYRWYLSRAYPRRDESGGIVRWYGYNEDIHEQVEAEEALKQSEAELAAIFESAIVGIAYLAPERGIIRANHRLGEILGRPAGELMGQSLFALSHPDDLAEGQNLFRERLKTGRPYTTEKRYLRPCGTEVWARVNVSFVLGEDQRVRTLIVAMDDITERKAAEAELKRVQGELIHLSRAGAMGAMGTTIAHELNQPLAAITNYLQAGALMLKRREEPDPVIAEMISLACEQALRAGEIVRRLRRFVAKHRVQLEDISIEQTIDEALSLALVGTDAQGVTCEVHLDPAAAHAFADRIQVQQVLINLVRNAIEAMEDAPVKLVSVESLSLPDGAVQLRVSDTGPGIDESYRDRLFAAFESTKAGGMGVGLSISRAIVDALGGTIWTEPAPCGGTAFCFTLPSLRPTNQTPPDGAASRVA